MGTWIGCDGIGVACTRGICARGASVRGIELRVLVGSGVNNRSREGTVRLIGVTAGRLPLYLDILCGWGIEKSNLDSRRIHAFDVRYIFLYVRRSFLSQIGSCSLITRLAKR